MVLVAIVLGFAIVLADPPKVLLALSVLYALSGPAEWLVQSIRGDDLSANPDDDV
jgi:hypothetical protein